jgi:probable blue pigment (indigoidine) exporter
VSTVSSSRWRFVAALILAAACWGVATVISKRAVDEIPPLILLPIQLGVSVAALAVLVGVSGGRPRDIARAGRLGVLGVLNPGLSYALSLAGLVHITASLSVVLWALEPVMILLLAMAVLGERVTRPLVVFSGVALAGMVLVIYTPGGGGDAHLLGVALTLAGIACCAVYTVVARRLLGGADVSTISVVLAQQAWALTFALGLLAVAVVLAGGAGLGLVSWDAWMSAVTSGLLYYAAAYWFYLSGLRGVTASFAAVSFYLIPVFGVAAGFALLGERLEPTQLAGGVVVLGAVLAIVVASSGRRGTPPG